jgi:hypothetical protein
LERRPVIFPTLEGGIQLEWRNVEVEITQAGEVKAQMEQKT